MTNCLRLADHRRAIVRELAASALLVLCLAGCSGTSESIHPDEAAAVEKIRALGGKVELSVDRVIKVYLHETKVTDHDLAHLAKLSKVQNLFLGKTQIGDAGLEHLSGLTDLKTLSLNGTQVTDAGLQALSKLKNLKTLNVQETQVTPAGAKRMRQWLPELKVAR